MICHMHWLILAVTLIASMDPQSYDICPCNIESEEIQKILDAMYESASGEKRIAISAPQIGIPKRIILIDTAATGNVEDSRPPMIREFINPELLWKSDGESIGGKSAKILVRAYDRRGNVFTEEFNGYTAYVFQGQIDHLDGVNNGNIH
jgi:peptide deformylase